jgi:hypothetical protein
MVWIITCHSEYEIETHWQRGGTYGMCISQTNLEFRCISERLKSEQYQEQFNSYVDGYTKQLSDN